MFSEIWFFFFCPETSFSCFGLQGVLNQQVIQWGLEASVSENPTAARQQKTDANYLPVAAGKQTFYDIYFALAELLLMPKKYKLGKSSAACFEMWDIIIWNLVPHLAILWPTYFFTQWFYMQFDVKLKHFHGIYRETVWLICIIKYFIYLKFCAYPSNSPSFETGIKLIFDVCCLKKNSLTQIFIYCGILNISLTLGPADLFIVNVKSLAIFKNFSKILKRFNLNTDKTHLSPWNVRIP